MTDAEIAYYAGVIDVLGMMKIADFMGRPKPLIEVRQKERALLDDLAMTFGGNVLPYPSRESMHWYWRRTFVSARLVATIVRPHLKLRTAAADEIIAWHPVPRAERRAHKFERHVR